MIQRFILIILAAGLLVSVAALGMSQPVSAQGPTPTPDPTMVHLQNTVDDLATQVAYFDKKTELHGEATKVEAQKDMLPYLGTAIAFGIVGTLIGIGSFIEFRQKAKALAEQAKKEASDLLEHVQTQTEAQLNLAFYRADPTYFPIHIPSTAFDAERQRLELLGFRGLRSYVGLVEKPQFKGIVIFQADSLADVETLRDFIQETKADPLQVAFVIYSPGGLIQGANKAVSELENVTFANNPTTIATHIYALARVLIGVTLD